MAGIDLILSAGDLSPHYLEFLVTMTNVPLLYVRGNHDSYYDERPPEGCVCVEDSVVVLERTPAGYLEIRRDGLMSGIIGAFRRRSAAGADGRTSPDSTQDAGNDQEYEVPEKDRSDTSGAASVRIAGLGGSMRYREGSDMYTEDEMAQRVRKLSRSIRRSQRFQGDGSGRSGMRETADILLTHAPCRGFGDMDDRPHMGFECFNSLLEDWKPLYHCYGHVHEEYGPFRRKIQHPSGATLINCSGSCIIEI